MNGFRRSIGNGNTQIGIDQYYDYIKHNIPAQLHLDFLCDAKWEQFGGEYDRAFHNIWVYGIEEIKEKLKNHYIIVAAVGEKLAILYGNCHMGMLEQYLINNPWFRREHAISEIKRLYFIVRDGVNLKQIADIFDGNGFFYITNGKYRRAVRKIIAGKQNICYDNGRKGLSRKNDICTYTKDKMDKFFLFLLRKRFLAVTNQEV